MLDIGTKIRFNQDIINNEDGAAFPFFAKQGDFGEVVCLTSDGAPVIEVNGVLFGIKPEWVDISG